MDGFRLGSRVRNGPLVADAHLGGTPIFVRGGSILTLGNVRQSRAEPLTELTLEVYPDAETTGRWTLVEDDGETFAYRDGMLAATDLPVTHLAKRAILTIGARRGMYIPAPRLLVPRMQLPRRLDRILIDNRETDAWRWDEAQVAAELYFPHEGEAHEIEPLSD